MTSSISITPLSTSNTSPMLTGYVDFERLDSNRNAKETISIFVNYTKYTLFDGNLGIDESVVPNKWKLHFSSRLYPGTYQVDAYVSDIATDIVVANDSKETGLTITQPTPVQIKQQNPSILEKVATVALLMASLDKLFGGKNGISPVPSVHPAANDESSTTLLSRGREERTQATIPTSKEKGRRKENVIPKPVVNKAVDPAALGSILGPIGAGQFGLTGPEGIPAALQDSSLPSDTLNSLNDTAAIISNTPESTPGTPVELAISNPFG